MSGPSSSSPPPSRLTIATIIGLAILLGYLGLLVWGLS